VKIQPRLQTTTSENERRPVFKAAVLAGNRPANRKTGLLDNNVRSDLFEKLSVAHDFPCPLEQSNQDVESTATKRDRPVLAHQRSLGGDQRLAGSSTTSARPTESIRKAEPAPRVLEVDVAPQSDRQSQTLP
jgi:hypothetical protein